MVEVAHNSYRTVWNSRFRLVDFSSKITNGNGGIGLRGNIHSHKSNRRKITRRVERPAMHCQMFHRGWAGFTKHRKVIAPPVINQETDIPTVAFPRRVSSPVLPENGKARWSSGGVRLVGLSQVSVKHNTDESLSSPLLPSR